ncbi:E3 ubiquitin-protein ligase znrf2-like [Centruroides vittatus]|uniref:E3 ubiquitin-protein ligase znrf2-like n=1 Tax=Centruroides vittatus TaxID=120091 RepID=UPI000C6D340A|nr:E3 ubiquitin-protein ligase znrf2-like isoform X1 [Centruroides sculpturatus]
MGGKQSSTTNSPRVHASNRTGANSGIGLSVLAHHHLRAGNSSRADARQRARSLSNVWNGHTGQPMTIPANHGAYGPTSGSPDSDTSTPDDIPFGRVFAAHSLPVQLVSFNGIKCPVCSKFVLPDDVECHLVMCLTKPRIIYNEDVLTEDKGECVICLEELLQGDTIARLPCLCIYHKTCIDAWFEVNRSCPEHPLD